MLNAFLFIIQKLINKTSKIYFLTDEVYEYNLWKHLHDNDKESFMDPVKHHFYQFISSNRHLPIVFTKFVFYKIVLDNIFLSSEQKDRFKDIFCRSQKAYTGFNKLSHIYKWKKAKIIINTDLYLNELRIDQPNVITLFDTSNNSKYLFIGSDLVNIIQNAIANSPYFVSTPISCKNPYTNIPFSKANLYNIYFFLKSRNSIVPKLIQHYFLSNFNLHVFKCENASIIREYAIKSYLHNAPCAVLHANITEMLYDNDYKKQLKINKDFPKETLISIMRPYLYLYYKSKFSISKRQNLHYLSLLRAKIGEFIHYNPRFGRKIPCIFKVNNLEQSFDDNHISFALTYTTTQENQFYNSHLLSSDIPRPLIPFPTQIHVHTDDDNSDDEAGYDSS